jgi:predicted DCC family thiol-disulfide oxidoreductase YuxK
MKKNKYQRPIIFFDGVCKLCQGSVRFIFRHDRREQFFYSSLQGKTFKELNLQDFLPKNTDSIILYEGNEIFLKSKAIFWIIRKLGGGFKILLVFSLLPIWITDGIYDLVAKYRYRIFGKKDKCTIPVNDDKKSFLE